MPCTICESNDHNRATCFHWQILQCLFETDPITPRVKKNKICTCCGGVGHNKRTCFQWQMLQCLLEPVQEPSPSPTEQSKRGAKRPMECQTISGLRNIVQKTTEEAVVWCPWSIPGSPVTPPGNGIPTLCVSPKRKPVRPEKHVTWMPGTISPQPSIKRLHERASKMSIAYECE